LKRWERRTAIVHYEEMGSRHFLWRALVAVSDPHENAKFQASCK
jgi:hypothetical protein